MQLSVCTTIYGTWHLKGTYKGVWVFRDGLGLPSVDMIARFHLKRLIASTDKRSSLNLYL